MVAELRPSWACTVLRGVDERLKRACAPVLSCDVKPWAHRPDCAPPVRLLSLVFLTVLLGTCGALAIVLIATGLSVSSPNQLPVR